MPDLDGMGVLTRMRQRGIAIPAIVQTAHGSIEAVISAMRAGADDFVVKPVGAERLQVSIKNALRVDALEDELRRATRRRDGELTFRDVVTTVESMARTIRLAERAAKSNIPVLIEGESGVGKELMARAIQGGSDRRGKPFVIVNCGALPATLVESILFGHEKGSFTGATDKHAGKFVEANGGTLFLDEIGELPLETQVKLLRALQEGEIDPVGSRPTDQGRFPPGLGDQQEPDRTGQGGPVPRGPVLSPQRVSDLHSAVAREALRRAGSRPALSRPLLRRRGQAHPRASQRRRGAAHHLRLAGQCPPARERNVSRRRAGRRRRADGRRVSADRGAGRGLRRARSAGAAPGRRRPGGFHRLRQAATTPAIRICCG